MEQDALGFTLLRSELSFLARSLFIAVAICSTANAEDPPPGKTITPELLSENLAQNPVQKISYRRQRVINQTLLRNPQKRQLLSRYEQLLQEDNVVDAVMLYQQILDNKNDSFEWTASGELVSVKTWASELFERQPAVWATYQKLYSGVSKRLYNPQKPETWRETSLRYFHTPSGLAAQQRLAAKAWDEGRFDEASRLLLKIIRSPIHQAHIDSKIFLQVYLATGLSGNDEAQKDVLDLIRKHNNNNPETIRQLVAASDNVESQLTKQRLQQPRSWKTPRQCNDFNLYIDATAPMTQPEWIYPKIAARAGPDAQEHHRALQLTLQKWSSQQQEHLFPEITSQFAVVAKNILVFRDYDSIKAIRLAETQEQASRKVLWQFESPSPVSVAFKTHNDPYTSITSNHPSIERLHLGNSVLGALTANNETVFVIDSVKRNRIKAEIKTASLESASGPLPGTNQPDNEYLSNRIIALPLQTNLKNPVARWSIDRFGWTTDKSDNISKHPLTGHYFLGPPTLSLNLAYILSEHRSLISLTALESSTGKFLWSQPISYADRPLEYDITRAIHACLPVYAKGTLVCDNGNGHLIAMDATTGKLMWLHCYADEDGRQDSGRWTYTQSTHISHSGVMNVPVPLGNRIAILPDRSRRIQCCELNNGHLLWSLPRDDVQYLAAVTVPENSEHNLKMLLLCIGNRSCKALNPDNGEEVWKAKTGAVCGHGVQVGNLFLLPVDTEDLLYQPGAGNSSARAIRGLIETIDIATGKRIHNQLFSRRSNSLLVNNHSGLANLPQENFQPGPIGNLLVCNDRIISVGIDRIISFTQAGSVIRQLDNSHEILTEQQLRQLAQAELILGKNESARKHLRQALSPVAISSLDREQTRELYREVLYCDLRQSSCDQSDILKKLKEIAATPNQQARYLATEIEAQLKQRNFKKLWLATVQFTQLGLHIPITQTGQQDYLRTSTSWLPDLYQQLLEQMNPVEQKLFFEQAELTWLGNLHSLPTHQLHIFAEMFSDYPQADPVRLELADRAIADGNCQQAELILLKMKHSRSNEARHQATQRLSKLYSGIGLYTQASQMLNQLSLQAPPQLASLKINRGSLHQNCLVHWDRSSPSWKAYRQISGPAVSVNHVSIQQVPSLAMIVNDPYSKRRSVLINSKQKWTLLHRPDPPPKSSSQDAKHKSSSTIHEMFAASNSSDIENQIQLLTFLDRQTGQQQFEITLPGTRFGLSNCPNKQVGHMLPVTASGTIYGISLIEGRPIWKWKTSKTSNSKQRVELGPVGQGYCLYQTARTLVCLDPQNGRLLWKRSDLEPRGGLWANRHTGLIGDKRCIVYFHADQNQYTLLDRQTGSILKTGRLVQTPYHVQRTRRSFGRKLMYLAASESQPNQRYLHLWDPLNPSLLIDEPFGIRDLYSASEEDLTILFSEGRLLIYHPEQERTIAKISFSAEELGTTNYLRVARQGDFYLVNLYRSQRADNEQGYTSRFTDSPWEVTHINGPVLAINKRSGQLEWIRSFSNRTIIKEELDGLPLMLTCATYQSRPGDQHRSMLIEILDLRTGNTLESRNDLPTGRLLLHNHNREKGEIVLSGMINDIVINYSNSKLSRLKRHQPMQSDFAVYAAK